MRELNSKQKILLDNWYDKNKDDLMFSFDVENYDNFDNELYTEIESLNDFETLHHCINLYIHDKISEDMSD